jgi:hypothetical protein
MLRHHVVFFALVASLAVAQSRRVDDFDPAALQVERVNLTPTADGGCYAEWCGRVVSVDGGATLADCAGRELRATVNVSRCAALVGAGEGALGRQLRLTLDGGAP